MEDEMIVDEERWEKWRFKIYEERLEINENLLNSKRHLDLGCGFGTFAKILAERYPGTQVYGIDSNREQVEIGKKRYRLANLHLLHSFDIVGEYDSITAFFVLHEVPDVKGALESFYKYLNADGRIMIYDFRKTSREKYKEWYDKGRGGRDFEEEYRKHNRWTVEKFKRICEEVGFRTIRTEPIPDFWLVYIGKK